jgi:hypothetical protein
MSRSSRCATRKVWSGANASAWGTTRGMTGTASMPFERICGRETGMRGMWAQLAARTMWCVGMRKTASETGCFEDGLDCTARTCVDGGAPRMGAISKDDGTRERGSWGGTTAAATDAISLRKKEKKKRKHGRSVKIVHRLLELSRTYSSPRA